MLHALFSQSLARRVLTLCVSLAAMATALLAQTPSAADGFDPNVDGNVYAVATQADGKILIGGQFTSLRPNGAVFPVTRNNLARLNADGTLDTAFDPNVNAPVRVIVAQPDGGVLIGGDFTTVQPAGTAAPATRNRIARLAASGALDVAFTPSINGELQPQVFALALQADGSIIVGGSFTSVSSTNSTAVTPRRNLARLSGSGAVDNSYDPNPNGMVLALALHAAGRMVVGGGFTTFQENGAAVATTRNRIARLNTDGTVDGAFNPNANNGVTTLAVQRDGKILLGGYFTTLQTVGWDTPVPRSRVARLQADGTLDAGFESNAGGNLASVAVQPDGGVLIGGSFTSVWGKGGTTVSRSYLARFTPEGEVDTAFAAGINLGVDAIAVQADGKFVVGGHFTRGFSAVSPSATIRSHVARFYPNGTLDATFQIEGGGRPLVSAVQTDGKIVIGGSFTNVGGATHDFLARLNSDGTVDASYTPDIGGRVVALLLQTDGKLVLAGTFTTVNGQTRNHIARLNSDGSLDLGYNPNVDGAVGVLALQSDGKIVIGGAFTSLRPNGATASTGRGHIARLNADGTLDTTFNVNVNSGISTIVLQSDGKLVFGGSFTQLVPTGATSTTTPTTRNRIARVNSDGTLDTGFDPNANGSVIALAVQADGKILTGGTFTTFTPNGAVDWTLRKYAGRLNADGTVDATFNLDINEFAGNRVDSLRILPDGRILIGGNFTSLQPVGSTRVSRTNFARLNANGTVDTAFDIGAGGVTGAVVNALAIQADDKIVAAGLFSDLGGARTTNVARFSPEGTPDASFGSTLTADGPINAIAVRSTGAPAASQLAGFAWLNANGSLRTAFTPSADAQLSGEIHATAFQADGSLLLGGVFANLTLATKGNLVRFGASGALDTSFLPSINGQVSGIAVQGDGRIIVVGSFTNVNGTTRDHIARLNADGTLDTGYDPNAAGDVNAVVVQSDGKAVIAGQFTSLTPNAVTTTTATGTTTTTATAVARTYLARLNTDGTVDTAYNPAPNLNVNALALQPDGKVVIGGAFTGLVPNGATTTTTRNHLARLNTDGTLDSNFDPNTNASVNALLVQPNGDIVLGGSFTSLEPVVAGAKTQGAAFTNLARVRTDGSIDRNFSPQPNGAVNALALQADGMILLGGDFTTLQPNGLSSPVTRNHFARINSDGTLDIAFNPDVTGAVFTIATRPDGSVLVAGTFTGVQGSGLLLVGGSFANIGGLAARNLALLNDDGSINSSFLPVPNGAINAILTLPDGKFVVAGAFTTIAGANRNGLARFNADGTLDVAFNPNRSGVNALLLQPDGKLLVAGNGIARLNADGSLDAGFAGVSGTTVAAIALQSDGRIVYAVNGATGLNSLLARLNPNGSSDVTFQGGAAPLTVFRALSVQTDDRIIVARTTTAPGAATLYRLNANGALDGSFNPAPNAAVSALALQSDGRLMIGGSFTTVGGLPRVGLARLAAPDTPEFQLGVTADRSSAVFTLGSASGKPAAVTFEKSTDRLTWTTLGTGRQLSSTGIWQLAGQQLPATDNFYLRARAIVPSSSGTSSSLYEVVRSFNFASSLFAAPTPGSQARIGLRPFYVDPFTGQVVGQLPITDAAVALPAATAPAAPSGSITSSGTAIPVSADPRLARLADISTRGRVSAESPLIIGFAVSGSTPQTVLLRAVGPSLARFGVDGVAAKPLLRLFDDQGTVLLENGGWTTASGVADATLRAGAFALDNGSIDDAAAVATLPPGTYTMHVLGRDGTSGVALAEIYDAGTAAQSTTVHLANLSSRGMAGVGGEAFIGGFVITGSAGKGLLVRGIGPTLAKFGVNNPLSDPVLSIYDAQNHLIATNDNWSAGGTIATVTGISTAAAQSGAFGLDVGSKDAALLITLAPGAYTVQVNGPAGATGAAMIEIYER